MVTQDREIAQVRPPVRCIGRDEQINKIKDRIYGRTRYSLFFVGAPKIGKTTLLNRAEEEVEAYNRAPQSGDAPGYVCAVRVPWREAPSSVRWQGIWQQLHNCAAGLPDERYRTMTGILGKYRKRCLETEGMELFNELRNQLPDVMVLFLLDDFDKAFLSGQPAEETSPREIVQVGEFLRWAHPDQANVALIAAATYPQGPGQRYRISNFHYVFEEDVLRLLSREHAKELVKDHLGENTDDEVVKEVLELTGNHPYYIETLCRHIHSKGGPVSPAVVRRAARAWESDPSVKDCLQRTWDYLELQKAPHAWVVLGKLARGEKVESTYEPDREGLEYLRYRGIVAPGEERISSALMRDYARQRLALGFRSWLLAFKMRPKERMSVVFWGSTLLWLIWVFLFRLFLREPGFYVMLVTLVWVIIWFFYLLYGQIRGR